MPTYGPWITPDPVAGTALARFGGTAPAGDLVFGGWESVGTDIDGVLDGGTVGHPLISLAGFGARADVSGFDDDRDYADRRINDTTMDPSDRQGVIGWTIASVIIGFVLDRTMLFDGVGMESAHPTLPSGATGYETEGSRTPDLSWLVSDVTIDADTWKVNPEEYTDNIEFGRIYTGHGLSGVVYHHHSPTPFAPADLTAPLSPSDVTALPLLATDTFTGATELYQPHLVIPRDQIPASGNPGRIDLVVTTSYFMTSTVPGHPDHIPDPLDNPGYPEGWYFQVAISDPPIPDPDQPPGCVYTLTYTYQQPRYRFIYPDVVTTVEAWASIEGTPAPGTEAWG